MGFLDWFGKIRKGNKADKPNGLGEAEKESQAVLGAPQTKTPPENEAVDAASHQDGSPAVGKKLPKFFYLYKANSSEELNLCESEISDLIEREYQRKIFPYWYDEEICGPFSNGFDSDTAYYFFTINDFDFQLEFDYGSYSITLTSEGGADDSFADDFADRLKQCILKNVVQRVASEKETAAVKITITSRKNSITREYMNCLADEDEVFEAVITAGAKIRSIGMTEVHDWDEREWYSKHFSSYKDYIQDEEHHRYICTWRAEAEYCGVVITFCKLYNQIRHGLQFLYDSKDNGIVLAFFEKFDAQCCRGALLDDKTEDVSIHREEKTKKPVE